MEKFSMKKICQNILSKLEAWYSSDTNIKIYDHFQSCYYFYLLLVPLSFLILTLLNFKISENAYFYTLSAIPQTLASLIALVGAFVIFKRDKLKTKRQDYLHNLRTYIYVELDKCSCATVEPYIGLVYLPNILDDDLLFDETSKCMEAINKKSGHPHQYASMIKRLNIYVQEINKVDVDVKGLSIHFNKPATFGLIAITFSIIMLPFGRITYPAINSSMNPITTWFISIIINLASLKLVALGIIIYLSLLSVFGVAILLDKILGLEYT